MGYTYLKNTLSVLLILTLFSSCSVQKRRYTQGYYTSLLRQRKAMNDGLENKINRQDKCLQPVTIQERENPQQDVKSHHPVKVQRVNANPADSCGDLIMLRMGDDIQGKVQEISNGFIKYYNCAKDTTITTYTDNIFMVKYSSGKREQFKLQKEKKTNIYIQPALVGAALFFTIVGWVLGFRFGLFALITDIVEPGVYKGGKKARMSLLLFLALPLSLIMSIAILILL